MKFSASLAAIALFVTASQSSPIDIEERGPSAKVTLCDKPNMQDCDTMYIPVNSCFHVSPCKVESLSTSHRVCDFYSEPGCRGHKHQYFGTTGSQPLGLHLQSIYCW